MLSKPNKKRIKSVLIQLRLWSLIKYILKKDIAKPVSQNLFEEGLKFYSQFIKQGDLVFDVGANFGNRVEIFIALGAKVVAIEPQKKCVKYLNEKYGNKIHIENVGLGSKNEQKVFYEADNSVLSTFSDSYIDKVQNTRHKTTIWKESNVLSIITLDELIKKYGNPKFIKIDVEGYEFEVISGLTQKSGVISFEYNVPELLEEVKMCVNKLSSIGYDSFAYSIGESMVINKQWESYDRFKNTIATDDFRYTTFGDIYAN